METTLLWADRPEQRSRAGDAQRVLLDVAWDDVEAEMRELIRGDPLRRPLDDVRVRGEQVRQLVLERGNITRVAICCTQQLSRAGVDVLDDRQLGA